MPGRRILWPDKILPGGRCWASTSVRAARKISPAGAGPWEITWNWVRRLRERHPQLAILFFRRTGGNRPTMKKFQRLSGVGNLFFPKTQNLRQAATLLKKCDAFLSVDTALMHVATAMNVRNQVVIETPTWKQAHRTLRPSVCAGEKTRPSPGATWSFIVTTDGASGGATRNCAVAWSR